MHSASHLMPIDICIKFHEYSLSGFQVIERTRFVTDRQTERQTDGQTDRQTDRRTDRQTDRRPGKNNMSPDPKGGRHDNKQYECLCLTSTAKWLVSHSVVSPRTQICTQNRSHT